MNFFKTKSEKEYEVVSLQNSVTLEALKILERTIDRLEKENSSLRDRNTELETTQRTQPVLTTNITDPKPFTMPSLPTMSDTVRKLEARSRAKLALINSSKVGEK